VRQAKDHFDFDVQSEVKSQHNFAALQNISTILQNRPEFLDLVSSKKKVSPEKMRPRYIFKLIRKNSVVITDQRTEISCQIESAPTQHL